MIKWSIFLPFIFSSLIFFFIYYFCFFVCVVVLLVLIFNINAHCTDAEEGKAFMNQRDLTETVFMFFFSITVNRNMNGAWCCRLIAFVSCKLFCLFTASGAIDFDKPIKFSVSLSFHTLCTNTKRFMVANDGKWFENIFHSFLYARFAEKKNLSLLMFISWEILLFNECAVTFVLSKWRAKK